MAPKTVSLSLMDQALHFETSDSFGFHYARVKEVVTLSSSSAQDFLEIALTRSFMHANCPEWRTRENVRSTDWLIWDIDEHYSAKMVIEKLQKFNLRFFAISTTHHQKEKKDRSGHIKPACDRFRVILPLETSIQESRDYAVTSKSLCRKLGLDPEKLDPASFSISGRWQPGSQLLAQNLDGLFVQTQKAVIPKKQIPPTPLGSTKGRLRRRTLEFLEGRLTKGWHYDLLFACADLKSALYTQSEAIAELERATGGQGLDRHHDLYQIDYVYNRSTFCLEYLPPFPVSKI